MDHDELHDWTIRAAGWVRGYHATLRDHPVRAPLRPGATASRLPTAPPETAEPMSLIWDDFLAIVPDAMTHWQHPRFFAYFPANAAPASMLAEMLANAIAAQGMLWQTAPAATEIEQVMVKWLAQALDLPSHFSGTIHDSATTATLSAVLAMRERALDWQGNEDGLSALPRLRLYASEETHSSVLKAARVAGIGGRNLVQVPTGSDLSMKPGALAGLIAADRAAGFLPAGVVLCAGGTSVGAFDRIGDCIAVARAAGLPVHVDAAWAGSAMICPEFRHLWAGIEAADSVVFNPHKWLGAQFDCAVQFLSDPGPQVRTLSLRPAYLATPGDGDRPPDFNDWTVPLGRRFRALKLWFLLRAHGLEGLRTRLRNHVAWSRAACEALRAMPDIDIVTEPSLSLFSFALRDEGATRDLLDRINDDGRIYLTGTLHRGRFAIRVQVGSFDCTEADVATVPQVVAELLAKPEKTAATR